MKTPPNTRRKTKRRYLFLIILRTDGEPGLDPFCPASEKNLYGSKTTLMKNLGQLHTRMAFLSITVDHQSPILWKRMLCYKIVLFLLFKGNIQSTQDMALPIILLWTAVDKNGLPSGKQLFCLCQGNKSNAWIFRGGEEAFLELSLNIPFDQRVIDAQTYQSAGDDYEQEFLPSSFGEHLSLVKWIWKKESDISGGLP